jgi:hypothetical protein
MIILNVLGAAWLKVFWTLYSCFYSSVAFFNISIPLHQINNIAALAWVWFYSSTLDITAIE